MGPSKRNLEDLLGDIEGMELNEEPNLRKMRIEGKVVKKVQNTILAVVAQQPSQEL